jgi:Na+/H+-dicarboxylate symporter
VALFKSIPFQIICSVILGILLQPFLSFQGCAFFYTMSLGFKDLLMAFLPLVIFGYVTSSLLSFQKAVPLLIFATLALIVCSNALCALLSYGVGGMVLPYLTPNSLRLTLPSNSLTPLGSLPLNPFITPDRALLLATCVGLIGCVSPRFRALVEKPVLGLREIVTKILNKLIIPLLPLYVFGFIVKLQYDGSIGLIVHSYGQVFVLSCALIIVYILFLYSAAALFSLSRLKGYLKEMLPPFATAFSTMSSAATLPLTLKATENNIQSRQFAGFIIPATVNIHLVGDGLGIPLASLALLLMGGHALPDLYHYLPFVLYYCLAKFSTAGVPGAGVLIILPVVEKYLGLSADMMAFLTALYILQDPIFTSANVMGNGAFAILTHRLFKKIGLLH